LYGTICYKRYIAHQAFFIIDRGQFIGVVIAQEQDVAVKPIHAPNVCRAKVYMMKPDFHIATMRCTGQVWQ
jgi:hypothetical protein